jgi:2-oxo-4-hydroxy-4-carboxy-5-ureidoimidazoline decarboxylase
MTGSPSPIALAALNALDAEAFTQCLGNVYEHAPWVAVRAATARPFTTVTALHEALRARLREAAPAEQLAVIRGHPDLAGKLARAGGLTAESTGEQASAGLDWLGEAEYAAFLRLNDAYRGKFGFPFIVCVRRHTKASILSGFETRLRNDADSERATALAEIDRIAALRLSALVAGEGVLKVTGRLSTHVLDTHAGMPAAGLVVALRELDANGTSRLVVSTRTNSDGRTDAPLIAGRPVPIGRYELAFAVGDYFAARAVPLAEPPFLDIVPVRFAVAEAEGNYHVPLLVTPWSYATYRGS